MLIILLVVRDKAFKQETCWLLITDRLGQCGTTVTNAIDKRALAGIRGKDHIIDRLDQHTEDHHTDRRHHVHRHDLPSLQSDELQLPAVHHIMHHLGNDERNTLRHGHMQQIDKRRIADDAGIGVEDTETNQVEDHIHEYRLRQYA